ncbi:sodium:solute symporter [Paenibacillus sp. BSR1-1]|uniref:sodium:solute symporter family protein n=1 Tax=Paenibacillus sp. BSR1-1 TaxID=3020845 RepID=UPI0025B1083F|nr:sodium:solute symporter [Paenibacillus sp. BSR1-1]MDN3017512.1 sodium:solute symporter [Paenibacillus sp. BSR1-1]
MNAALLIIIASIIFALTIGIRARKGKDMNLEQWTVGGRGFGTVFIFLLMAGETYSTFTFLGGSGWAYGKGGPTFYILIYGTLALIMSYWYVPAIWRYAKEKKLMSQSDFFVSKYNSPYLGVLVSIVGVVAVIPYLVLQLKGLGSIVSEASYGAISPTVAIWIGVIVLTIYVMISGIHGSAWTAVVKDILILGVTVFLGIYLPLHYYGGYQPMFEAIDQAKSGFLTLPSQGLSISWFISTVLLTSLGFYMYPHAFGAIYSGKNEKTFRKNTIIMPLYQLILLFVFFAGFAAILQIPGLKGDEVDLSLLRLSKLAFDPWVMGVIGAAGVLTALVPGSMLLMSAATLLAKNVYGVFVPSATDKQIVSLAKYLVPVVALVSLFFTFKSGTIVALLLMGSSMVTQLFPAMIFSLMRNNFVTKQGAFAGIILGEATVAYITLSKTTIGTLFPLLPQWVKDINVGIIALTINVIVMTIVSMVTKNYSVSNKKTEQVAS